MAVTANPSTPRASSPAFYVNVQCGGEAEVVHPPPGRHQRPVHLSTSTARPADRRTSSHSNLVADGHDRADRRRRSTSSAWRSTRSTSASRRPTARPPATHGWYAHGRRVQVRRRGAPASPRRSHQAGAPVPGARQLMKLAHLTAAAARVGDGLRGALALPRRVPASFLPRRARGEEAPREADSGSDEGPLPSSSRRAPAATPIASSSSTGCPTRWPTRWCATLLPVREGRRARGRRPLGRAGNTSLYLETPDLAFFHAHAEHAPDRCKLRVRAYGDPPREPGSSRSSARSTASP